MKAIGTAALVRGHCCGSQHEAGGMGLTDQVWSVKCGHHRGWCPAGGAGGNLDLANGGPPGGWRLPAGEPGGVVLPVGAVH